MKNIVLARIDDRLIHGQVVVSWLRHVNANEIIVIDDEVANDKFLKEIMIAAAPSIVKAKVLTINEVTEYLRQDSEEERIILLCKLPQTFEKLIENKIKISTINLGGIGSSKIRKQIFKSISLSDKEIESLKNIENLGTDVEIQILPNDKTKKIREVI